MKKQDPLKPTGTWEVRHRIKIPALVNEADAIAVERAVSTLSGVRKVATDLEKHQLILRYDASQTGYQVVLEALENIGFPPLNNWWSRFKGGWFQFADTNASDNAKAPPPSCCNKPPK
jgi:copper chaperone CopZ